MSKEKKPKLGRPRTTGTNKIREVGRCSDADWQVVVDAAELDGRPVATWAREVVIRAAKKRLSRKGKE